MSEISVPQKFRQGEGVHIALIGMSGAGKSFWSKKMEDQGYRRYSCDDMIAERLGPELQKNGKTTLNLAKWMGEPYAKDYPEAEALYLELESAVIAQICDDLEHCSQMDKPVVVDTTGSLIYLKKTLLKRFRNLTRTVHLNLPEEKHEELFEAYLLDPKPVIWKGKYLPLQGESPQNALSRCYRELLSFRNERYDLNSDIVLDYSFHHCPDTGVKEVLESVGKRSKS
ncbi:MAG TPA: hypothetical protein EYO46_08145 [Candidatus Lambdaproteobacteria bacterium]|nr:hypothetical protein [Candidatus Lambdaproteobacteria bacterium]HIO10283.1 hypothetical protein [Deltaproteobacteria bacterium]